MTIGIIGIILALIIFLYGAYKNVSVLYLAPLCGVIVAIANGLNATEAFTGTYIGGVTNMVIAIFPTVFLGGLFGKVLADCGAADAIALTLINKFVITVDNKEKQVKRAVLTLLLIECILTYGGVDGFVAVFATFPIAMIIAEKVGIPRRFVPALLCLSCGANSAPFVLSINNIIAMNILQTSAGAAAIPGLISFVIIEIGVYFFCQMLIIKAMRKGESFDMGPVQLREVTEDGDRPAFIVSLIPLIAVFILFAVVQNASLALVVGILLTVILMNKYYEPDHSTKNKIIESVTKVLPSLNAGAANGASALMTVSSAAGFAAIVEQTAAFEGFVGTLFGLSFPPLIVGTILIIVVVALTSSPPAALSIALPLVATSYIWVAEPLLNPAALARVAAIAVSTFETLPVNGLIILTTGLARVKVKDAYLPMFMQTVFMTLIGTIICLVLVSLFPGLA